MSLNPELLSMARYIVGKRRQKLAFQPPQDPSQAGGDPSQAGGAPVDPSQMAAAGGDPSQMAAAGGDPSQMAAAGGDPSQGGGAPVPGGGGLTADSIRQIMQETLSQMGIVPGMGGAGGGMGKPGKPDPAAQGMDIFQIKKMLMTIMNAMGLDLPQDILDGPNRDPATGMPMAPGAPGSTSDPTRQSQPASGGGAGGGGGQQSSIKPISGIQGAFPQGGGAGGGGGEKSGAARLGEGTPRKIQDVRNKAAALSAVLRRRTRV